MSGYTITLKTDASTSYNNVYEMNGMTTQPPESQFNPC